MTDQETTQPPDGSEGYVVLPEDKEKLALILSGEDRIPFLQSCKFFCCNALRLQVKLWPWFAACHLWSAVITVSHLLSALLSH